MPGKFLLFLFILFLKFSSEILNGQELQLSTTNAAICPGKTAKIEVQISGQLPVWIEYTNTNSGASFRTNSPLVPFDLEFNQPGNYVVTAFGNNNSSKVVSIPFVIFNAQEPTAVLSGGGYFCENENITPITVTFTGTSPWTLTYQLNYGNAIIEEFSAVSTQLLNTEGIVNIRLLSDQNCSAELWDTSFIDIDEIPNATIDGLSEVCPGNPIEYTALDISNNSYNWIIPSHGIAQNITNLQDNSIVIKWKIPGIYNLYLTVFSQNEECVVKDSLTVSVLNPPQAIEDYDTTVCFDIFETILFNPAQQFDNLIIWQHTGDTINQIEITEEGTYFFLEISPQGCADTGYINVVDKCTPSLFVPEAFTPNGDGINDVLEIFGANYNTRFYIYTTNGELVYTMFTNSLPWDGKYRNTEMPNGTYIWEAFYTDRQGTAYSKTGQVVLIR